MRGLISHEESQTVASAFFDAGHDFMSCDKQPCSGGRPRIHIQDDVFHTLHAMDASISLDFYGAHPDCTFLTNAGLRWLTSVNPRTGYEWNEKHKVYINPERWKKMELACIHFRSCYAWLRTIGKGYIENPIMHPYAQEIIGIPYSQIVHPHYFGTPQRKATCLWIVGLPNLVPDNMLEYPKDKKERAQMAECMDGLSWA